MKKKPEEKVLCEAVLSFLVRPKKVLLAKKMAKIGAGLWNGHGGGIENGQSPEEAAVAELKQEAGVMVLERNLEKVAELYMHNTTEDGTKFTCHVIVFFVRIWNGAPISTEEMSDPTWFDFDEIPINQMLPADKHWLPLVLSGKKIKVDASYGPHQKKLLSFARQVLPDD